MKKAILPAGLLMLMLLLSTGCGGTAPHESASNPPTQYASDAPHATQTNDPGTPASPEAVPSTPPFSEIAPSTPPPSEVISGTPPPTEAVPSAPASAEVVSSGPPGNDPAFPLIYQNPELPNGCEITSLAMLLAWAGYPIDKVELANNYLPKQEFSKSDGVRYGPDPNRAFAGDPSSPNGWYCFEGPILEAADAYLSDQNTTQQAAPLSETTREELENYMNVGIPLAVWVTLDYSAPRNPESFSWYLPDGSHYIPYSNLHCVVLAGWDGDNYKIANPINGWQTVSPDTFWSCFDAMGRRAVAVLP